LDHKFNQKTLKFPKQYILSIRANIYDLIPAKHQL